MRIHLLLHGFLYIQVITAVAVANARNVNGTNDTMLADFGAEKYTAADEGGEKVANAASNAQDVVMVISPLPPQPSKQPVTKQLVPREKSPMVERLTTESDGELIDVPFPDHTLKVDGTGKNPGQLDNEKTVISSGNVRKEAKTMMPFTGFRSFDEAEETHFLYYMLLFGAAVICVYLISHNKKKILGMIIEGRRPPSGARRTTLRYRRLSQRDDGESGSTNVIY